MSLLSWTALGAYRDYGLLLMRVGLGTMMVIHGGPKVMGGPEVWASLGGAMGAIGVYTAPVFWGAAAAFTEAIGGALVVLGLATRPAALLIVITMVVAAAMHLGRGDGISGASHAIEVGFAYLGLLFVGPGRFSIDVRRSRS